MQPCTVISAQFSSRYHIPGSELDLLTFDFSDNHQKKFQHGGFSSGYLRNTPED